MFLKNVERFLMKSNLPFYWVDLADSTNRPRHAEAPKERRRINADLAILFNKQNWENRHYLLITSLAAFNLSAAPL
jgi:hypothetical protein